MSNSTHPTLPPVSLERASTLLAELEVGSPLLVSEAVRELIIQPLIADLFGVDLERVKQLVEFYADQERQFRIHDGQVAIRLQEDGGRSFEVVLGTVDIEGRTAVLLTPWYINRSQQFNEDVISSTEIGECRGWLELKGFQVTEKTS